MNRYRRLKVWVFNALEKDKHNGKIIGEAVSWFITGLIFLNIVAIVLESFEGLRNQYGAIFYGFEVFSVTVFTLEYILRIWTSEYKIREKTHLRSKIKYIFSPMAIIDLIAILPFYLHLMNFDLRFVRILRLTRLLRILKLTRYSNALKLVGRVLKSKKDELLLTVFMTFTLILIASILMYYLENDAQPDKFPNIPATLWWAVATLTTVGYGDVYPITNWGRLLSGIIAILGIGMVALPTAIISSSFMEVLSQRAKKEDKGEEPKYCPHCGKNLDE
ncbi:MAG: ion transporter [Clostridia bacterium]|nr:ion transporter [Clostridia bacterium]